jgi:Type I phosphodiesterase / nucleotide pyrophosphatase
MCSGPIAQRSEKPARLFFASLATAAVLGAAVAAASPATASSAAARAGARHIPLISVDGLHQADLTWYVKQHPHSYLAQLANSGIDYTNAQTTNPSGSFPGMVAQLTGGTAAETGVYYDDTFNTRCIRPAPPTAPLPPQVPRSASPRTWT